MKRLSLLVLATGFTVLLFNSGSRFAIGLLLKPMAEDLSWSRSTVSSAVGVFMILSALALPLVGRLVDRFGAPWVLGAGATIAAFGVASTALVQTPLQAMLLYGVVFALGSACTSIPPIAVMVTRRFPNRTGLANSVAISGMGVGQLLIIALLASWLDTLGWRGAFVLLGVANLALLPLIYLAGASGATPMYSASVKSGDQTSGLRALEPQADTQAQEIPRQESKGQDAIVRLLVRRRSLLLFALYAICGFQDFFVATHVVAYATDQGIAIARAGNVLALMGLFGLVGVLLTGGLSDRFGPLLPTTLCFVLRLVLFALVLISAEPVSITIFALLYGATFWITAPLTVVFVAQLFGPRMLGTLTGAVTMVHHIAGGLGAWFGAWIFDRSGSYFHAFTIMLVMCAAAIGLAFGMRGRGATRLIRANTLIPTDVCQYIKRMVYRCF